MDTPKLSLLLQDILITARNIKTDAFPRKLCVDSRFVDNDSIFAAINGIKNDGTLYIPQAVSNGASAVIHAKELAEYAPQVEYYLVSDIRKAVSRLNRLIAGKPDEKVNILGITGTNGKTTTAFLLRHLLNFTRRQCGLISTVEYDNCQTIVESSWTTPDPGVLFTKLADMHRAGARFCAMEFSSHALAQHRVEELQIAGAIFTNLTGDHLDFHLTMENYAAAKMRLFTDYIRPGGIAVLNYDDPFAAEIVKTLEAKRPDVQKITFGRTTGADCRICNESANWQGSAFTLQSGSWQADFHASLPGAYNVSNFAGAILLLRALGMEEETLHDAMKREFLVPGRLQHLSSPAGAEFFIDFAHTHDALQNVLQTLRPLCKGKLTVLFGAGGDRDRTKRPKMGAAAAAADKIILTSDNPRSEDPEAIMDDVSAGIPSGSELIREVDRRKALQCAVATARKGDIVLIAGKGHENTQEIAGVKHHFNEVEILQQLFQKAQK